MMTKCYDVEQKHDDEDARACWTDIGEMKEQQYINLVTT